MSFFRKRQPSQTAPVAVSQPSGPLSNGHQTREIPGPSEALKLAQQSQVLNQRVAAEDRPATVKSPIGPNAALPPTTGPPGASQRPSEQQQQQPPRPRTNYPWSARQIQLAPPLLVPRPGMSQPTVPSPSPFPRYGHSLPATSTASGELFIFGGLVRESVKDDLYSFSTNDMSCSMVQTTGDVPSPRVGHASALVSSVLIVWGGDTKTTDTDRQDNCLYLLNLGSREWTRVAPQGPAPAGRYGHAVTMCGTKFYVYGGQVDGEFLDDLWCFDLSSLKRGNPQWENLTSTPGAKAPAKRTGHVMVTYGDKIFLFGGTDGQYHYNDTWCFDTATGTWSDLQCIGYIPLPREGHAAALVDDVIYVFGGRGVDGKDLSDLAAFKISNRRWYMFQHMGPSPSGRSGHSMASAGSRVFVIGGESSTVSRPDDPNVMHVLETKSIKYPESSRNNNTQGPQTPINGTPQQQPAPPSAQPQRGPIASRAFSPQQNAPSDSEDSRRNLAASPTGSRPRDVIGGPAAPMQPFPSTPTSNSPPAPAPLNSVADAPRERMRSPVQQSNQTTRQAYDQDRDYGAPQGSEDDEVILGSNRSREGAFSPDGRGSRNDRNTARSPTPTNGNPTRALSPTTNGPSSQAAPAQLLSNRLTARSPSPVVGTPPPGDAFHYGGRPAPAPVKQLSNGSSGPRAGSPASNVAAGSIRASPSNEVLRDLRTKDAELESARRRETWMRAALLKARSQGFIWGDQDLADALRDAPGTTDGSVDRAQLQDLVLKFKSDYARMENAMSAQARLLSERFAEAERIKTSALQEAAFYRTKLSVYESGSAGDVGRLERDRAAGLERQLASAMADRQSQDRRVADLTESLTTASRLREQSEDQISAATKRAETAEANHSKLSQVHDDLQERHASIQSTLREHSSKVASLTSLLQQREADHNDARTQLDTLSSAQDQHVRTLQQLENALTISTARADEAENQWNQSRDRIAQLEAEQVELRNEIETRVHEAEASVARAADLENAWSRSREEADGLRALTTGSLGKLIDSHNEMRVNAERGLEGQGEKITALEEEVSNLQLLLKESEKQSTTHQNELTSHRRRVRELTAEHSSLHSQVSGLRAQLAEHTSTVGQLRQDLADHQTRLREATRGTSDAELRLGTLRNYLGENGITVDIDELITSDSGSSADPSRVRELETQLTEKTRQLEALQRQNGSRDLQSALSGDADASARAENAERALAEAVATHKQQMAQKEEDYQTAVHYVNRTEKMMRRVKEEHTRQKALSASLQGELDSFRSNSEASSRTRVVNGRNTPLSDDSHDNTLRVQLGEATRQLQRATAENTELHKAVAALQAEVEQIRDQLNAARRESDLRIQQIEELEGEMDRLEAALQAARHQSQASFAEQLHSENDDLRRQNGLLQQRIDLLLDVDQPGRNPNRLSGRPDSRSSSIKDHAIDALSSELDDWLATSSSSRRPLSEYEPEIPQRSLARGPLRVHGA